MPGECRRGPRVRTGVAILAGALLAVAGCSSSSAGPADDAGANVDAMRADAADAAPAVVTCSGASAAPIPAEATQALLVLTPTWTASQGTLARFTRPAGGAWTTVGSTIPVEIGAAGLGWGRGLHGGGPPASCSGATKQEGDHRTPAGVFTLGAVYGDTPNAGSFPYTLLTSSWRCPDDPASAYYNQVLDQTTVTPDWNSAEIMLRPDGLYHWVVFVDHNADPVVPGAGSCIFIHVWGGPSSPTVGCTSLALDALEGVLAWLDQPHAVMIALPQPIYDAVRASWQLP
jgi:L,D-peptidoglycan transpeptidase YkuD (ErfK/YbiS/YcfS/YnhG family)